MRVAMLVSLMVAVTSAACVPSVDSIARRASKAAVGEGAEALTEEKTQQSLDEASRDPQVQAAATRMTDQIAEGVLKSLASEQGKEQIAVMTKTAAEQAVKAMMAELGSKETRGQLVGLTGAIADATMKQVADSLQTELRPAVRAMVEQDIGPSVAAALGEHLQPALAKTADTVAYNAVVGANRSLGDALSGDDGLMRAVDDRARAGLAWVWLPLSALFLVTLMMVAGAVMMVARARRTRAEVDRLESATLLLATAMRERQPTEANDSLVRVVQESLAGRADKSGKHRLTGALGLRKSG